MNDTTTTTPMNAGDCILVHDPKTRKSTPCLLIKTVHDEIIETMDYGLDFINSDPVFGQVRIEKYGVAGRVRFAGAPIVEDYEGDQYYAIPEQCAALPVATALGEFGLSHWLTLGGSTAYGIDLDHLGEVLLTDNDAGAPEKWTDPCGIYFMPSARPDEEEDSRRWEHDQKFDTLADFYMWVYKQIETTSLTSREVLERWVEAGGDVTDDPEDELGTTREDDHEFERQSYTNRKGGNGGVEHTHEITPDDAEVSECP